MDDLISRQAAIDALKAHEDYKGYLHGDFEEILEALPSAQPLDPCETCLHKGKGWDEEPCDGCTQNDNKYEPDNGWIPVSERLPDEGERVLATVNFDDPFVCEIDYWKEAKKAECDMEQMNFMESIIAWMPLPEPYRSET